ncbi:uncharacterized protein TRUGW13939_04266 [Talaromyces rugulosus]|uniref:aldehyde dehydrogenase (NAD(+)) n=1 Tax=Talaromyces rugulosus TaxID=121627 RepID=A0A7H8QTP3_TALRU|nr:uncharacterized protein TRUGW13939_04266 [Talaromyces rugulosus]QKX57158.1 hypothetical protein TRUGW13939_04266 [Talaromyces rugulosus]
MRVTRSMASKAAANEDDNANPSIKKNTANISNHQSGSKRKAIHEIDINGLPHNLGKHAVVTASTDTLEKTRSEENQNKRIKLESPGETTRDNVASAITKSQKTAAQYGLTPGLTPYPDFQHPTPAECEEVNRLLSTVHGEIKAPSSIPQPSLTVTGCGEVPSVLDALIRTILSGATTGANAALSFQGLVQRFGILDSGIGKGSVDWNAVREAPVDDVFQAMKSGGLATTKSKYIKEILDMVYEENQQRKAAHLKSEESGEQSGPIGADHESKAQKDVEIALTDENVLSLDWIHALDKEQAMLELIKYPGIGPKTAACVVLFCLQRPCFAVDTHIFRILISIILKFSEPQLLEHLPASVQSLLDNIDIDCETLKYGSIAGLASVLALYFGYLYLLSSRESPVKFNVPLPPPLRTDWQGKKWEDLQGEEKKIVDNQVQGKWKSDRIVSYCPADGRILASGIPLATSESVDRDIQTAKRAQAEWAQTTYAQRRRLLKTLLKYVLDNQDDIVTACCLDSGKTRIDATLGEILVTTEKLKWTIDHGEKALATERRPTNFLMMYKKNVVRYEPLGVVSACVSWNYPFHNLISPVISALFAGNAIVVKPSEQTAWSSTFFIDIIRRALTSCGHSPDLVQLVICLPQVADVLTSHPDISQLTFIGSRPVAHKVCESAARSLTPVTVELGGKDPFVILDDATTVKNLSSVASILMRGVYQSAGQNCVGAERVIALPGVYDKLIDIVTPRVQRLVQGSVLLDSKTRPEDPNYKPFTPDIGAMISPAGFARLESLVAEAVEQGARLLHGGKQYHHPKYPNGHFFTPTLLVDVTPSMRIAQAELFAPIMTIMRATSVADAISVANSTPYALGASVFGFNAADVEACVSGIKAGMVAVNDFGAYYAVQLPFGGVKGSGYGRFAGEEGLRGVSNLKSVCVDRFPRIIGTAIPPAMDYPIYKGEGARKNGSGAGEMCKGVVQTGYEPTIAGRVRGILRILANS